MYVYQAWIGVVNSNETRVVNNENNDVSCLLYRAGTHAAVPGKIPEPGTAVTRAPAASMANQGQAAANMVITR